MHVQLFNLLNYVYMYKYFTYRFNTWYPTINFLINSTRAYTKSNTQTHSNKIHSRQIKTTIIVNQVAKIILNNQKLTYAFTTFAICIAS